MTPHRSLLSRGLITTLTAFLLALTAASSADAVTSYTFSRSFGTNGPGKLQNPGQMAIAATTNDVFLVEIDAGLVKHFTKAGDYVGAIDVSSRLSLGDTSWIAIDPASGDIYVAGSDPSSGKPAIDRFHASGGFVSTLNLSQVGAEGITQISGIAADSTGRLYVSDNSYLSDGTSRHVVQVFSSTGTLVSSFDGSNGPTPFTNPAALAVGASNAVYVLNIYNGNTIQRFSALGAVFQNIVTVDGEKDFALDSSNGDLFSLAPPAITRYTAAGARQARFGEVRGSEVSELGVDSSTHTLFAVRRGDAPVVEVYVPFAAPAVSTTDPATGVTGQSAHVAGSVNPQNRPTTYQFEYSTAFDDPNTARSTTDPVDVGSGNTSVAAGATITGLQPNRTYTYRLKATNDLGPNFGETRTLITDSIPPAVGGESATAISSTSATVNATVNPENNQATAYFEYGPTDQYGSQTVMRQVGQGDVTDAPRAAGLSGLSPNTTYHYRIVADNGVGSGTRGTDHTFTTAPPPPTVGSSEGAAQFTTTVNTGGQVVGVSFLVVGTDNAFSASTTTEQLPAGPGSPQVRGSLGGLPAGNYTVRVRVQTAEGTVLSDPATFSTPGVASPSIPLAPAVDPFPFGCAAPRLAQPAGTLRAGRSATLTGVDLGATGYVTFGSRQVKVTRYSISSVTVVVPSQARGRVPISVSCGRTSNRVTARVSSGTPSNRFSVSAATKGTSATVRVKVPGRGAVSVSGSRIGRRTARPSKAGTVAVKVGLTESGRANLSRAKSKRLTVPVAVSYRPAGGATRIARRTLVFHR